ncbi:hypothetical protein FA95DRAFT_1561107 [Auriscalpium vulgare]|uniref:Uncharacterized protein n=1 Tax=Auriscalpium vulgare TaxID=40419 RepID=A0ACB8RNH4_9AGAM|nr:hypothetical protein FA95DRAFT_1561107 [Auriscalpium vulgare]
MVLPRTLRHFGYHSKGVWEHHWEVKILVDAVRRRPELRLFTATRCSSQTTLKQLEGVCREGGVEFGVYANPACFPVSATSVHLS